MVFITRQARFSAAHRYYLPHLSEEGDGGKWRHGVSCRDAGGDERRVGNRHVHRECGQRDRRPNREAKGGYGDHGDARRGPKRGDDMADERQLEAQPRGRVIGDRDDQQSRGQRERAPPFAPNHRRNGISVCECAGR